MPVQSFPDEARSVRDAAENLRIIRELMERSTKYSTFSGLSGVFVGLVSIAGCLVQYFYVLSLPLNARTPAFLVNWTMVVALALGIDTVLTKRRAAVVGKTIRSRLGKQMVLAAGPGLGTGVLLTLYLATRGALDDIYPLWMLTYGSAVCAVGLFSQKAVSRLGWAFLVAGAVTLAIQLSCPAPDPVTGLMMMGLAFGGFHIAYGCTVSRHDGP